MTEQYTTDYFSQNIDNWTRWLEAFRGKPEVRAMEIGSFEGRATVWLLENILTGKGSSIDCFDLFEDPYFGRFTTNVEPWKDRVRIYRGHGFWTMRQHEARWEGEYDIIYVDANHDPAAVTLDAALAWRWLKVGGVMIFDDYLWLPAELTPPSEGWTKERQLQAIAKNPAHATKTGIDAFLASVTGRYEVVGRGYQMAVRKTVDLNSSPRD